MELKKAQKQAHENAKAHGFWDNPPTVGESLALMHSELSESLEEHRNGRGVTEIYYSGKVNLAKFNHERGRFEDEVPGVHMEQIILSPNRTPMCKKPEGIPMELADAVIRIMDFCEFHGIDLEAAIEQKMAYNESRPFKHGKIL